MGLSHEMPNRLLIDFKEDCHGHITGPMKFPADGAFVLEAFLLALGQFAESRGATIETLLQDLYSYQLHLRRKDAGTRQQSA